MKRILSLLLAYLLLFCTSAMAENAAQARIDSGIVGVWIETEGYGTLTMRADGTATMVYHDNIVSDCNWELTEEGGRFTDGMWFGSSIEMENENVLSVAGGWMRFTREGIDAELSKTDWTELNPVPVGEDGQPFLGEWHLTSIEMEGASMSSALLGMEMVITLTEDGLVTVYDGLETLTATWFVSYGAAVVDGMPMTLRDDGHLVAEEDGAALIFTLSDPTAEEELPEQELSEEEMLLALLELMASTQDDEAAGLPDDLQPYVGEWHLCYCATGGLTGDLRTMGITGTLILNADGTGTLSGLADESGAWYDDDGIVRFGESGMPLSLHGSPENPDSLFLQYGSDLGGYMIFHQDESAVWTPSAPTAAPAPAELPASAPVVGEDRTEIRFVGKQYTSAGYTGDASVLGAEYAVIFHKDGTADFTMASFTMPALPYTITEDGVYAINYYGTFFNCVPTATGFDLDYYGTMTLHLVPEG